MGLELPLLSLLIWLPIAGGLLVLATSSRGANEIAIKGLSLIVALVNLLLCVPLVANFDNTTSTMQFQEHANWLQSLDIYYSLGIDGISLPLILLTCFMTVLVVIAGFKGIKKKMPQYFASFLIMEGLMCGVFSALDSILFYVFWEAMLIPMFLIIGIWGGPNRIYATIKFFLYTFLGSVFMLVALVFMHYAAKDIGMSSSFAIETFQRLPLELGAQKWIFFAFLIAFAVKVPMWPVHTWLPDAHVEAPTGGSVILAAILLKMGAYGFLRFLLPIVPDAARSYQELIIFISLIAVVYIGLVALAQRDMKKLIAYSSIAHMGFVTLGLFVALMLLQQDPANSSTQAVMGVQGAMVQLISHGFISGALFLCVGVLYDRMHSRQIKDYGGVVNKMPIYSALFMVFALANAGLPGTSGFVGEFLVILSAFKLNFWYAFFAATTLVLGAAYTLWMYKRVIFGEIANVRVKELVEADKRELLVLGTLALAVLALGLWPLPLLNMMQGSIDNLMLQIAQVKVI